MQHCPVTVESWPDSHALISAKCEPSNSDLLYGITFFIKIWVYPLKVNLSNFPRVWFIFEYLFMT